MKSSLSIALSGLVAAGKQLAASASNTANSRTDGPIPGKSFALPADGPQVYEPVTVVQQSLSSGAQPAGVAAAYQRITPGYVRDYNPSAPYADADGMVAAPNVDAASEALTQIQALDTYRANLRVLGSGDRLEREAIDLKA
jgi:flagellar basal-body rod protein FlgC